ncbi:dihydrofolate reductase family protein [Arthrobacter ginkgonis]|uniref:Dihydrofolate reductase family protein n=1 Tax=Arthrobacter ginkgonis TaxID=1630594 RepID=A0ABP7CIV6_9MICC
MPRLRVHNLSMSLDGYVAGPRQDMEHPLGLGGEQLHGWLFATAFGQAMLGHDGGSAGVDHAFAVAGTTGIGATIMGRNMFGPVRGPWLDKTGLEGTGLEKSGPDEQWRGWWGANPPFHHPVFVMTHYLRPALAMEGGTTFHFVDAPPEVVLELAVEAAGGGDVRLGGGAATVRAFLAAGLVDELHVALVPVLLGGGERLFDGPLEGYAVLPPVPGEGATHFRLAGHG